MLRPLTALISRIGLASSGPSRGSALAYRRPSARHRRGQESSSNSSPKFIWAKDRRIARSIRTEQSVSIKGDKWIRRMAAQDMIEPFEPMQVRHVNGDRIVTSGTSSYGYDIRCPTNSRSSPISTARSSTEAFDPNSFVDLIISVCIIPNSFALERTVEYFRIPRNVLTICLGKSTYALRNHRQLRRWGLNGRRYMTLEFSNTTTLPAKIYAHEGCAQVIFIESDEVCENLVQGSGRKVSRAA